MSALPITKVTLVSTFSRTKRNAQAHYFPHTIGTYVGSHESSSLNFRAYQRAHYPYQLATMSSQQAQLTTSAPGKLWGGRFTGGLDPLMVQRWHDKVVDSNSKC